MPVKVNQLLLLTILLLSHCGFAQTIIEIEFWTRDNTLSKKLRMSAERERTYLDTLGRPVLFYPADGTKNHIIYTYGVDGKPQKEITYSAHGDSSVKQYELGGLEAIEINYSGNSRSRSSRHYVYRRDGLPDTIYTTWINKGDRMVKDQLVHTYDAQGRLIKKSYRDSIETETLTHIYQYDETNAGGARKVKEYLLKGRHKKKLIRWTKYNAKGLVKEEWSENLWTSYRYEYNDQGEWIVKQVHEALDLLGGMGSWVFKGEYRRKWVRQ